MTGLLDQWYPALPADVDPPAARRVGEDLLRRWNEPHRRYHDQTHLTAMLSILDSSGAPSRVRLAAWYHDAVYDPTRADNEERSAALAEATLPALGVDPTEVARLVRLTAGHDPDPADRDGALLCDADLAILAAGEDDYDRYSAAVRQEYAHVPDDDFRAGRAAVLRHLLGQPRLYRSVPDRARWEQRARANLSRELARLDPGRA
ncbi:MAG TPA: metal-dependent phosphohydrolase [Micromonosporaceae bacterium]